MPKILQPFKSFFIGLTLLFVFFLTLRTPNDPDMWWHLRSGYEMVSRVQILTNDIFSYTRFGNAWANVFWLADIGIYLLYRVGGFLSLSLFVASVATGIMTVILKHSPGPMLIRLGLLLIAILSFPAFMSPRPQILTFILLAILDYGLTCYKKQNRNIPAWLLIPFFILWANLHGGYFLGFLLLAAVIIGETLNRLTSPMDALAWLKIRQLLGWGSLAWLGTIINPTGLSLWKLPFYTLQVSLGTILEYASPNFHRVDMQPILWLIFLLIVGTGFSKRAIDWADLLKFCGFAYMAFVAQRSIPPFVIVALPMVSRYLAFAWDERLKDAVFHPRPVGNNSHAPSSTNPHGALLINTIILLIISTFVFKQAIMLTAPQNVFNELPQKAVSWIIENHPQGRLFNSYNWGGYLIWTLPQYPVFIDGRADLYGDELMREWSDITTGTDKGLLLLDQWQIKIILLESQAPLIPKLSSLGWQQVFKDEKSVIWTR